MENFELAEQLKKKYEDYINLRMQRDQTAIVENVSPKDREKEKEKESTPSPQTPKAQIQRKPGPTISTPFNETNPSGQIEAIDRLFRENADILVCFLVEQVKEDYCHSPFLTTTKNRETKEDMTLAFLTNSMYSFNARKCLTLLQEGSRHKSGR